MKTTIRIALCLLVLVGVSAWNVVEGQKGKGKKATSTITIVVPPAGQEETEVTINGKVFEGEGGTRTYKTELEQGKEHKFKIDAVVQPNNYTHIYRTREITLKGGENAKVDLTVKDLTDKIKARWYPTPNDIVDEMGKLAKITKDDIVYDLGCGDAVMLIRPLQKFGAKKGVGIEIDPKMVKIAKDKVKDAKLTDKIEIREGDILNVKDMSDATVVLLYIGDDLGERLSPVLQKTLKPGARIVSHRFSLGDWKPDKTITVKGEDGDEYDLLMWTVSEKKAEVKKADK